ncbi:zinc ribbon domain-containing protein [Saccharopolyspora indica]|uniref:FmdB family zinc ribbon protein n=1 Tax=Saccharopolyspora indica TaxID=1229659 RepID=UPI0022EA31CC|nr:FmdB family zinc ribbon protein [Saccharopolyspora indica]MDA3647944.1 zinc ribbon domain-containing protein [Saccharopolyspora indica]
MPLYAFRCPEGTEFDLSFAMREVPASVACPACGEPARRRVTAPRLSRAGSAAYRLIDSTAASAHEPAVVTSLPSGPARRAAPRVSQNPLHSKLPRP